MGRAMLARVLVIDDTGFDAVVEDALLEAGCPVYDTVVARSLYEGAQALWQLCWTQPDQLPQLVVITTCFKSGMSGYRLLGFMQGHPLLRGVAAMMCSVSAVPTERSLAYTRGAAFYIDKSAGVPELARVLARVVPARHVAAQREWWLLSSS